MTSRISEVLQSARDARVFSAAAWSHGNADGVLERGILGTLAWDDSSLQEDSRWDLASVTKPIVALAVISLIESGELTLDDTVGDFLPDFPADKSEITVRQLLTHTSGLPGQVPLFRWSATPTEMRQALRDLPLIAAPDSLVIYSSQGYMILGLLAEAASSQSLDSLVVSRVFAPAGMENASFGLDEAMHPFAVATEHDPWRGHLVQGEVHDENAVVLGRASGHAGIFATLSDLEKLARALCNEGEGENGALLSQAGFRAMTKSHTDHLNARWTLGWAGAGSHQHGASAGDFISPAGFGHTGFTGTSLWIDPTTHHYSILLTNRVHPHRSNGAISRTRVLVNNIAFASAPRRS